MIKITCGAFVIDKLGNILLCRATGSENDWTVPKGLLENDEMSHIAAKRELLEETGIDINKYPYMMYELGVWPYAHKNKVIVGFLFMVDAVINQTLFCESHFTSKLTGMRLPEVDMYQWLPINDALEIMRPEQVKLIKGFWSLTNV